MDYYRKTGKVQKCEDNKYSPVKKLAEHLYWKGKITKVYNKDQKRIEEAKEQNIQKKALNLMMKIDLGKMSEVDEAILMRVAAEMGARV